MFSLSHFLPQLSPLYLCIFDLSMTHGYESLPILPFFMVSSSQLLPDPFPYPPPLPSQFLSRINLFYSAADKTVNQHILPLFHLVHIHVHLPLRFLQFQGQQSPKTIPPVLRFNILLILSRFFPLSPFLAPNLLRTGFDKRDFLNPK